jgi:hypothetical protein
VTNAPAYYGAKLITTVKSFSGQALAPFQSRFYSATTIKTFRADFINIFSIAINPFLLS